jgi:hypothetical protein
MVKHIFVSYAREDKDFAQQLNRRLRESHQIPWQDRIDLKGGQNWQDAIDKAVRTAEALVVVMSPHATKSQYVTYEWAFALGAGVPVIPVVKKLTTLHPRLSTYHYIDFTTGRGTPFVGLLKALPTRSSKVHDGGPEIRAKFDVVAGKLEKEGNYYVIRIYVHNAPRTADQVTYEFHDETLKKGKWSSRSAAKNFESAVRSNGDSVMTAEFRTPGKKSLRIATSLYDALKAGHGSKPGPRIKRALREILKSRTP